MAGETRNITAWQNILEDFAPWWLPDEPLSEEERIRRDAELRRALILQSDGSMLPPEAMIRAPAGLGPSPLDGVSSMGLTGGDDPVVSMPPRMVEDDGYLRRIDVAAPDLTDLIKDLEEVRAKDLQELRGDSGVSQRDRIRQDQEARRIAIMMADGDQGGPDLTDVIKDLQEGDNTRVSVGDNSVPLMDDAKAARGFGRSAYGDGIFTPSNTGGNGGTGGLWGQEDPNNSFYEQGKAVRDWPGNIKDYVLGGAESVSDWAEAQKQESWTRRDKQDADMVTPPRWAGLMGMADPSMNSFEGQIGGMNNAPDDPYWQLPGTSVDGSTLSPSVVADPSFPAYLPPSSMALPAEVDPALSDPTRRVKENEKPGSTTNVSGEGEVGPIQGNASLKDDAEKAYEDLNWVQKKAHDWFGVDSNDARSDLGRALLMGGAATMAGDSPYALQNIGGGVAAGTDAFFGGKDERLDRERAEELMQMKREDFNMNQQAAKVNLAKARKALEKAGAPKSWIDYFTGTQQGKIHAQAMYDRGEMPKELYEALVGSSSEDTIFPTR